MADDRRFDDAEVAYIIRAASADASPAPDEDEALPPPPGLSLTQIEQIGAEAGLSRDAIRRAAAGVTRGDHAPTTVDRVLGLPYAVSRTADLGVRVSDIAWDRFVLRLRDVFQAQGRSTREGSIREWRNGNLRITLEPTPSGDRLRMSTRRGDAVAMPRIGVGLLAVGIATGAWLMAAGSLNALLGPTILVGTGAFALVRNLILLPPWARQRARQMEALAPIIAELVEETDGSSGYALPAAEPREVTSPLAPRAPLRPATT